MPETIFQRRMIILAAALALCLCLAGCGKKQTTDNESYLTFLSNTPEVEDLTPAVTETPTETVPAPLSEAEKNKPIYVLKPIVEREMFELTVFIPDDYPITITDFELWADGELIGERTPIDKSLRHLAITKETVSKVTIAFEAFLCHEG